MTIRTMTRQDALKILELAKHGKSPAEIAAAIYPPGHPQYNSTAAGRQLLEAATSKIFRVGHGNCDQAKRKISPKIKKRFCAV